MLFLFMRDFFEHCGKTEIMNSNIKSNVSEVQGGTPNICACVTGYFFFLDEPHHIRLSTMIKSNMYAHRFYANSVNSMLLQYLDFVKSGVPQMKQELNKRISNISSQPLLCKNKFREFYPN